MNLYETVAYRNPEGAKKVINSYGSKAIRRPELLAKQLADTVNRNGKEALYRIISVHPDLEIITHFNEYNKQQEEKKSEPSCDCKDKGYLSADGQAIKDAVNELKRANDTPKAEPQKSDRTELMIIGAVALVGLALVLKK